MDETNSQNGDAQQRAGGGQGGYIEAVSKEWIREQISKAFKWALVWPTIGVVITLVIGVAGSCIQVLSKQEQYSKEAAKQQAEFAQSQSKEAIEFKASMEKSFAEFKGQVGTDFAKISGRIDKVESQIAEVKDSLRRIEAKMDRVAAIHPLAPGEPGVRDTQDLSAASQPSR